MIARAVLLALTLVLPVQAQEGVWMPMCISDSMTAAERNDRLVPASAYFGYDVLGPSPGVVMYRGFVDSSGIGSEAVILEHCESRTRLVAILESRGLSEDAHYARADAVWTAVRSRAESRTETYSFDEVAEVARALGARTVTETIRYQSCACATPEAARW